MMRYTQKRTCSIVRWLCVFFVTTCGTNQMAFGSQTVVTPIQPVEDGPFKIVTILGSSYYQVLDFNGEPAHYIYFDVPDSFVVSGQPLFVQVFYREYGNGSLGLEYDSSHSEGTALQQIYWPSEESYGTFCSNGRGERQAVFMVQKPRFQGNQNGGADCRLFGFFGQERLTIRSMILWTTPPPFFSENSVKPWLQEYSGPTRNDIDRTTIDGKVLCGYQGWFNTPNDGAEMGYRHWSRDPYGVAPGTITVDYWPDVSEYDPTDLYQVNGMTHPDGQPSYLYSAFRKGPVLKHFQWMRQYGIDGVFLSRFISETVYPQTFRHINMVLAHVREGCHLEGRIWAIMYDVSGSWENMGPADVINDWKFLCDQVKIRQDTRYLYDNGKPVVLLWGFGFTDRNWTAQQAAEVIEFFKNDPAYGDVMLIGGVDPYWRTLTGGSKTEPEWAAVYRSFDAISTWDAGRYIDFSSLAHFQENVWAQDIDHLNTLGKGYMPTVFPGFSWDNLNNYSPGQSKIPRMGGEFLWKQFYYLKSLGVKSVFVGMFDEVDEGTAIYKVSDQPPVENYFLTYEGKPKDWYLKITGTATMMMRDQIPLTDAVPPNMPFPINETNSRMWTVYK